MSQLLGQILGQTRPADSTFAALIGRAFGANMAIATPVTGGAADSVMALAGSAMVVFVPLVMVIILLPGPLQTPGKGYEKQKLGGVGLAILVALLADEIDLLHFTLGILVA